MKRVAGLALFFVALGIILSFLLPNRFVEVLIVILCAAVGYSLFCC